MWKTSHNQQQGQAQTEYLPLVALIVIASLTILGLFGDTLQQQFSHITEELAGQQSTSTIKPLPETPADPETTEPPSVLNNISRAGQGLFDGFKTQVDGYTEMVLHPIDTAQGIATIAYALVTDTEATLTLLKNEIGKDLDAFTSGDPYEVARIVGEYLSPVAMLKVANKLAKFENHRFKIKCSSFAAGTLVWQQNSQQAISLLEKGDTVYSRSEQNYKDQTQKITHTIDRTAPDYYQITTESNNTIQVTAEHPFWVQSQGWIEASTLKPGTAVATINGDLLIRKGIVNLI